MSTAIEDAPFSRFVINTLKPHIFLLDFYLKHIRLFNYGFVALIIGVSVSYTVYHVAAFLIWEPIAYCAGVLIAGYSNYFFSVGPGGRLFGLEKEVKEGE